MNRRKFKIEDYNKKAPHKDATKYFIIYEGVDKEPNYFEAFCENFLEQKKAYVHHLLESNSSIKGNMPKNLIERVKDFILIPPKEIKFTPSLDDKFRFVLDVDKHPINQIEDLKEYSDSLKDSKLFISNYCFEIWLWLHLEQKEKIESTKSKELKKELGEIQNTKGINFPHSYISLDLIKSAIDRSIIADTHKENYFPVEKSTKIYLLINELLEYSILNNSVDNAEIL